MSGPYQRQNQSNCGARRLRVANNLGVLSVNNYFCCTLRQKYFPDENKHFLYEWLLNLRAVPELETTTTF